MSATSPSNSYRKVIDLRINCDGLPRKAARAQRRKSARSVLSVFLSVMKDCGYTAAETKAALKFFAEDKP